MPEIRDVTVGGKWAEDGLSPGMDMLEEGRSVLQMTFHDGCCPESACQRRRALGTDDGAVHALIDVATVYTRSETIHPTSLRVGDQEFEAESLTLKRPVYRNHERIHAHAGDRFRVIRGMEPPPEPDGESAFTLPR